MGGLNKVEKGKDQEGSKGGLMRVGSTRVIDDDWEEITITVDSGAIDHVTNERDGSQFKTKETDMSKKGGYYKAANDTNIYNEGMNKGTGVYFGGANGGDGIPGVCSIGALSGGKEDVSGGESGGVRRGGELHQG